MAVLLNIADGVDSIELPLPLEGLTSMNCYVVRGDRETVLVDPGWSSPETQRALEDGLDHLGISREQISRILVTHHHWDHYTQAIAWQRKFDIPVALGKGEDPNIEAWYTLEGAFPRQGELLVRAGAGQLATAVAAIPIEPHERAMDYERPAHWVGDADEIDLGGITLRAISTPGHTRGHVCYSVPERGLLLTGDHVLPRITPSVAFEREPDQRSLINYLGSLRIVADLAGAQMLPAHGAIGGDAGVRAVELVHHHDARLEQILQLVGVGHSTAFDVARAMTWTRRERALGDLELIHQMTAVLEVAAHITLLSARNQVCVEASGDTDFVTLA